MAKLVIGVIGAGGKTTAIACMAQQCKHQVVFVTTTTHIFPMSSRDCRMCLHNPTAQELQEELKKTGILCAGIETKEGKLGHLPQNVLDQGIADADVVLYEGDGAHCMPLKLHRSGEPVLLSNTDRCLIVIGLSALGHSVSDTIHRYHLHPDWQENPDQTVGIEAVLYCIQETVAAANLPYHKLRVFLNQEDTVSDPQVIEKLLSEIRCMGLNVRSGCLKKGADFFYRWIKEDGCLSY